jgi:Tfp pilus assembly pilus retraction ATPase PilT
VARVHEILRVARLHGVDRVHLAAGAMPLMRGAGRRLEPVPGEEAVLEASELATALSLLSPPERWNAIDLAGSGEVSTELPGGGTARVSLLRGSTGWSAVITFVSLDGLGHRLDPGTPT